MPWKETSEMDQRVKLLADWLSGDHTKCDLCEIYRISCPTTDKWISRYHACLRRPRAGGIGAYLALAPESDRRG